jgi:hypothetical protein
MVVAVAPLLQVLDVPPLTVRLTLWPLQMVVSRLMVVLTYGLTVTVTVSVVEHLPLSLLVTVYRVVALGETVMEFVVAPVFQVRDVPPLTERVTEPPWQIV